MLIKAGGAVLILLPRPAAEVLMELEADVLGNLVQRLRESKDRIGRLENMLAGSIVEALRDTRTELTRIMLELEAVHTAAVSRRPATE